MQISIELYHIYLILTSVVYAALGEHTICDNYYNFVTNITAPENFLDNGFYPIYNVVEAQIPIKSHKIQLNPINVRLKL